MSISTLVNNFRAFLCTVFHGLQSLSVYSNEKTLLSCFLIFKSNVRNTNKHFRFLFKTWFFGHSFPRISLASNVNTEERVGEYPKTYPKFSLVYIQLKVGKTKGKLLWIVCSCIIDFVMQSLCLFIKSLIFRRRSIYLHQYIFVFFFSIFLISCCSYLYLKYVNHYSHIGSFVL